MFARVLAVPLAFFALNAQKADLRVDVRLVTVTCSVTGRANAPAKNLSAQDFTLRDNGKPQKVEYLWQEAELPLTIGLIVDVSGSQSAFIDQHRQTVARFLRQVVGPKDRAFLATVGPEVNLITDLTGSADDLRRGVENVATGIGQPLGEPCQGACGGTALWNGVYAAANQKMRWTRGRKALIVLSDGIDTGSTHSLRDAIESAQEAEAVVYAIKYVDRSVVTGGQAKTRDLERLTDETGGYTFPNPDDNLANVFARIEEDLRNLYVIGFTPPESARDGRFHKLDVKMIRKDLFVRARNGYYAP